MLYPTLFKCTDVLVMAECMRVLLNPKDYKKKNRAKKKRKMPTMRLQPFNMKYVSVGKEEETEQSLNGNK